MRGSSRPSRIVASYVDGGSPPVMSIGLPAAPKGGMKVRNASSRSGGISIRDRPLSTHGVGQQHTGAAGAGDDDDVVALGRGQHRQRARVLQHVVQPGARMTPAWLRMSS